MKERNLFKFLEGTEGFFNRLLGIEDKHASAELNGLKLPYSNLSSIDQAYLASIPRYTIGVNDVSGSMGCKDCKPSRLGASKLAVEEYLKQRVAICPEDRIALVSFNSWGKTILPFTSIRQSPLIIEQLTSLKAGGGTDIKAGLKEVKALLSRSSFFNDLQSIIMILLLTDGQGGHPVRLAEELKSYGVLIEVIGVGGNHSEVNETLLRKIATTDPNGINHYRFIYDTDQLVAHYSQLASGLVWRNGNK